MRRWKNNDSDNNDGDDDDDDNNKSNNKSYKQAKKKKKQPQTRNNKRIPVTVLGSSLCPSVPNAWLGPWEPCKALGWAPLDWPELLNGEGEWIGCDGLDGSTMTTGSSWAVRLRGDVFSPIGPALSDGSGAEGFGSFMRVIVPFLSLRPLLHEKDDEEENSESQNRKIIKTLPHTCPSQTFRGLHGASL
jgi:hypothetical protein